MTSVTLLTQSHGPERWPHVLREGGGLQLCLPPPLWAVSHLHSAGQVPLLLTPEHIQLSRPRSLIEAAGWSLLLPVPLPTHADQRGYQSSFCFQDPPSCDPGLRPQLARQNTWDEAEGLPGPDPSPGFSQTGRELPIVGVGVIWGGVHCTTTQGGRGGWAGGDEGGNGTGLGALLLEEGWGPEPAAPGTSGGRRPLAGARLGPPEGCLDSG